MRKSYPAKLEVEDESEEKESTFITVCCNDTNIMLLVTVAIIGIATTRYVADIPKGHNFCSNVGNR